MIVVGRTTGVWCQGGQMHMWHSREIPRFCARLPSPVLDKLIEAGSKILLWATSKPNRLRLSGARIEVIATILADGSPPQVLLGESRYGVWMLPQEGVSLKESLEDALSRCLREE